MLHYFLDSLVYIHEERVKFNLLECDYATLDQPHLEVIYGKPVTFSVDCDLSQGLSIRWKYQLLTITENTQTFTFAPLEDSPVHASIKIDDCGNYSPASGSVTVVKVDVDCNDDNEDIHPGAIDIL